MNAEQGGVFAMEWRKGLFIILCMLPSLSHAGGIETSIGFYFNKSNYGNDNFVWNRRWGVSIGYYFTDHSELEWAFQDIIDRTRIAGYEDTTFHDNIYSINWVQTLVGKSFPVQPYVKVGVGQLNRNATGTYSNGVSPNPKVDSVTGVLGAGLRIYVTRTFGIRGEATTYLSGGKISTWKDNIASTMGLSFYF